MTPATAATVHDHSELRARLRSIEVGSRITLAAGVAALAYAFATWGSPHRTSMVVLIAVAIAWAFTPIAVGAERIVHSTRREALFAAWSTGAIGLIGVLVALDGGARSPLALLFFLPVAFAALSYPQQWLIAVGALDLVAFLAVGLGGGSVSVPYLAFFGISLGITALLCGWEARDHERQRRELARVSRTDPLTRCLNRRGFEERFAAEIDAARRGNGRLGLVVLDLDHFKAVNDTRGHAAGDELLSWSVARAGEALRPMDSLGRLGGDEFALLVPGAGPVEALEVAGRVRAALAERVSVSTGVASFPTDGIDADALHRHADAALYAAKQGRGSDTAPTSRDLTFASALARAVNLRMSLPDERSSHVGHYAVAIAERLGFDTDEIAMLRMASILHDIGKVSVPDRVLSKPGPLTGDEYEQVKAHPQAGAEIVAEIDGLTPVADWIRHSHEHLDGSGYPAGLSGDAIPLASRVLRAADAFDAMTRDRPYGTALPPELALEEMRMGAGRQFDRRCVDALASYLAEYPDTPLVLSRGGVPKRFARSGSRSAAA